MRSLRSDQPSRAEVPVSLGPASSVDDVVEALIGSDDSLRKLLLWCLRHLGRAATTEDADTVRLLTNPATARVVRENACARIAARAGVPETILVPGRARAVLFGRQLIAGFAHRSGVKGISLEVATRRGGRLSISGLESLNGHSVLIADVAAGHGDTIDELALLATQVGAATLGAAVLLSRLSEPAEEALDQRFSAGFTRLYSIPFRPITVRDRSRQRCPVCRRRQQLLDAVSELPEGPARELAKGLASARRFRRRTITSMSTTSRQIALFPLSRCRRGVASGITLHALCTAMGDGMAPLSLPELNDAAVPSASRAAMVQDLPPGALAWSGKPLMNELQAYLRRGREKEVWMAVTEFLSREGSSAWIDCLHEAIPRAARSGNWMDDRFWAWMICKTHHLVRERPELADRLRGGLAALVADYDNTPVSMGLQGMLATVSK